MVQPLSGLSGIAGLQFYTDSDPQATPEQRNGGTADPKHAEWGETAQPYQWESKATQAAGYHPPVGPENQLLDDFEYWFTEPAGVASQDPLMDRTPSRRAAPWPKGIASGRVPSEHPDDIVPQIIQGHEIRGAGREYNASANMQNLTGPKQDNWVEIWEVDSGHTDLQPLGSRQAMSSGFMWGSRDRLHSFARQNEYGFDSKHMHRRFASSPIPGNTYWMRPGGRPMVKSLAGPARPPIGVNSPFTGQDLGAAFSIDGAYLQNVPTEYVAPPQPTLASADASTGPQGQDALVEWY